MSAAVTDVQNVDSTRKLQAGGTLNPKKHIYIRRPQDDEVLRLLLEGEYVNVLTSRQMGKSSLMAQTAFALRDRGVRVVSIDLAGELGSPGEAAVYYRALLQRIARSLELPIDLKAWWQEHELESDNQKLLRFFKEEVGGRVDAPVVIFLDEIDSTLKLPFTDDLFTALRTMNNERAFEEALQRITFCLLGVATPNELIKDRRTTPYNVGQTLELRDFDAERDDLAALARALHADPTTGDALLARVLHWTGGHPYLTNRLCQELASTGVRTVEDVDRHIDEAFKTLERVGSDVHIQQILRFVEERFTRELASLDLYARILKGAKERDQTSLAHAELKLSGLVKRDRDGCLIVRNPIYARLFDRDWVESTKPQRTLARTRGYAIAASIALALALGAGGLYQVLVVGPEQQALAIRQQLEELQISIVQSEMGDGLRVEFPVNADQALLDEAAPLLLDLPDKVIELDLQPQSYVVIGDWLEINDLTPLTAFEDLKNLELWSLRASDIAPLQNLTQLQKLDLNNTQTKDLSPLQDLTALQTLWLNDTEVADIGSLENLTALRSLGLSHTHVRDIGSLRNLSALLELSLAETEVKDITSLRNLTALQTLNLNNTQVADIAPLENLTALQELYLTDTQVADIAPLENLNALQALSLADTQVADISPLDNLTALQTLSLTNTQVADIAPLNKLTALQTLDLTSTQVADIAPLDNLTTLQTLWLENTQVTEEDFAAFKADREERGIAIDFIRGPNVGRY